VDLHGTGSLSRNQMPSDTTIVFGVPVPSVDPVFLIVVRFHIVVGVVCVLAGGTAMLSRKGRGRHSTFGTVHYWCLAFVATTATSLSVVRWAENYHLFILGTLSLIAATIARRALRERWRSWVRLHIVGMGLSYILMLTAFYVDNARTCRFGESFRSLHSGCCPLGSECRSSCALC
jgi:cell division protein FtsW (lipid II flippase)